MIALISRIIRFSGKYKGRIYGALVFSLLKSLLSKAPIVLAFYALIRFYNNTADAAMCLQIGMATLICVVLQIICQHYDDKLQASAGYMIMADKRMELGAHLRRMKMGYFTEGNIGKISSVLATDMAFIESGCMMVLADLMSFMFAQAIMVIFLLAFDVWLGLAAVAFCLISFAIAKYAEKQNLADSSARQEQSERLTEAVIDHIEGIGIIKTYNLMGEKSKELSKTFQDTCDEALRMEKNLIPWMRWVNVVLAIGSAVIIGLSLHLNSIGMLSAISIVGVMLFAFDAFGPIKSLYSQIVRLTIMNSCLDRFEALMNETELPDDGVSTIPAATDAPEIQFENVSFAYGEKDVLRNISFKMEKHQMIALVGPSGGGKSTIASLLPRFWDVKSGRVLIRGKDIRDVKLSDLMNHISMVFQRVYLFRDTIYNNISMGSPDSTEAEVIEAARKARCYDFIMALPNGFQTMVGEGGETLSGGERQRISIARCMLKDAPIVILDEATASVDADNESYIQQAISELCRGKTLLIIAHRLNTIRGADNILAISNGQIAEQGTHEQLMQASGLYQAFVTARENSKGWNRKRG